MFAGCRRRKPDIPGRSQRSDACTAAPAHMRTLSYQHAYCLVIIVRLLNMSFVSACCSMGDHDFVKPVLSELGTVHFGRVLMKPGKPLVFASLPRVGDTMVCNFRSNWLVSLVAGFL